MRVSTFANPHADEQHADVQHADVRHTDVQHVCALDLTLNRMRGHTLLYATSDDDRI